MAFVFFGANDESRTRDLLITNELLYQLSYIGLNAHLTLIFTDKPILNLTIDW